MFTTKNLLVLIGRHALIALATIGVASLAVFFLAREIGKISNTVVKSHRLASTLENRTELFTVLKRDAEMVGKNDELIEHSFVPSDNILEFVATLESLALRNSIVQSFRFETPSPAGIGAPFALATISYTNSVSSNISMLSNYLKDFERLPYFTKIEGISIASQDPTAGLRGVSTASFRAVLYTRSSQ